MTVLEKRAMVDPSHPKISICRQCELLDMGRASYYRGPGQESVGNLEIMRMIDEEYLKHPFYGSRKMKVFLNRRGIRVNRKKVQRLMRLMGLEAIFPGRKKTTLPAKEDRIYPYLLRGMEIDRPGQVWCSDFTYIPLKDGFAYLTVVMDWYSRYVLSWEVSIVMDESFCVSSLERALRKFPRPDIFNTDQGSQYTGEAFTGVLENHEIRISMDGKGRAMDNIMVERLWRSLKYEDIYIRDYETVKDLLAGLTVYFDFYNNERPHQSLDNLTPAEVYVGTARAREAA